jgi:hypothetical protein
MIEGGRRARFLLESAQALGVAAYVGGKDFDRDIATEPRASSAVDLAHAAAA